MTRIRRLVLDVLKPHHPGILELGRSLAEPGALQVKLTVLEMDEKTETLQIEINGADIDVDRVRETLKGFGASLHSIDEVEVDSKPDSVG